MPACEISAVLQYNSEMSSHLVTRLIYLQAHRPLGHVLRMVLRFNGIDVPPSALMGVDIQFPHCAAGVVIDERTRLGNRVQVFQHVTIGRARIWETDHENFSGVVVEDDAVICAGAVVVCDSSIVVGRRSIIAANAVLTQSIGPNEIWAGAPARCIGKRA